VLVTDAELGARVAEARQHLGLTQEQLGGSLGLTRSQMCKIEKGERRIAARELGAIAGALSCDVESLLFPEYVGSRRFRASANSNDVDADVAWLRRFRRRYDDLVRV
jgi:transcriptional regulator with XRE-family HTH domain